MAEGPALKKQRLSDIEPDNLPNWLGAQVEDLCTKDQKSAIQNLFGDYSTSELQNAQISFLDYALSDIISDKNKRLRVLSALQNATCPAPPAPVPRL